MTQEFKPPYVSPADMAHALQQQGFALMDAAGVAQWLQADPADFEALTAPWDRLVPDAALDVPLYWQQARAASTLLEQLTQAVIRAAKDELHLG